MGGLITLSKLQVLSLGHNELSDLHGTVMYLRQLPSLQSLCLRGNQFSPVPSHAGEQNNLDKNHHYQMYCLAFIPSLIYLDYQMIMQEAVSCTNNYSEQYRLLMFRETLLWNIIMIWFKKF